MTAAGAEGLAGGLPSGAAAGAFSGVQDMRRAGADRRQAEVDEEVRAAAEQEGAAEAEQEAQETAESQALRDGPVGPNAADWKAATLREQNYNPVTHDDGAGGAGRGGPADSPIC